jgi:hypoxanthine phosphoribosyltransferase
MVGVLNGAFMFAADLGRAIRRAGGPPVTYGFLKAGTYGDNLKDGCPAEPVVSVDLVPDGLAGQDVLLVDDILDQGFTLAKLRSMLLDAHGARTVTLCVAVRKVLEAPPDHVRELRERVTPDYVGFDIPDRWVVGYGLDAAGELRDLPCIAAVKEEFFR